jgi:PHD/YefM family antitoxin component YafN of YafNO toxin-antitoxin module
MKKITLAKFVANAKTLVIAAAMNDDFLEITLENGESAVLVSKPEWSVYRDAMLILLANPELLDKNPAIPIDMMLRNGDIQPPE